jgi:hypothetical protein
VSRRGEFLRKKVREYMYTKNPGIGVDSRSCARSRSVSFKVFLLSVTNQNCPGIVSESVSRVFVRL